MLFISPTFYKNKNVYDNTVGPGKRL